MAEFNDIHKKDLYFQNKLEKIEKDEELSKKNKEIILRYLRDSELGKTLRKGRKRKIDAGRNLQVASFLLNMAKNWFPKTDLDKVSQKQMESFVLGLDKGKIKTPQGKAYASETKANIKKFIRKFYKWLLTDNKFYPEVVEWIDTSVKETLISAIPGLKEGVWKVVELIPDIRRKALVWVAFDSGFRQGEIINCSLKDVEKDSDGVYYITCHHSKTKPRTVSLPHSSELLDRWIAEHPHGPNSKKPNRNASLWMTSRARYYQTFVLYTQKALGNSYSVHQIRHTSATYWAPKLDRVSFCKRFGWSYNSKTPDRYIDFAKVTEKKVIATVKADQYAELKAELDAQRLQNQQLKEQVAGLPHALAQLMGVSVSDLKQALEIQNRVKKGKKTQF